MMSSVVLVLSIVQMKGHNVCEEMLPWIYS